MNPAHEALTLVRELLAHVASNPMLETFGHTNLTARSFYKRAKGIVIAAQGEDGAGVRQRPANQNRNLGWCSSCGAYHELTGDPAESIR